MNLIIYFNQLRKEATTVAKKLEKILKKQGVQVYVCSSNAKAKFSEKIHLGISVGGDGTLISLIRNFHTCCSAFVGINAGSLGFLTQLTVKNLTQGITKILKGIYQLQSRRFLEVKLGPKQYLAVNDVYFVRKKGAGLVNLIFYLDDFGSSCVRGDGLIISSPTGSTAYSLAAGGPIVYPECDCVVLTPICSHSLGFRPLVLPNFCRIKVKVNQDSCPVSLLIDGHIELAIKDEVAEVKLSEKTYNLVVLSKDFFVNNLKNKLNWA